MASRSPATISSMVRAAAVGGSCRRSRRSTGGGYRGSPDQPNQPGPLTGPFESQDPRAHPGRAATIPAVLPRGYLKGSAHLQGTSSLPQSGERSLIFFSPKNAPPSARQTPGTMIQTDRHYLNSFQALHPPGTTEWAPDVTQSLGTTAGRHTVRILQTSAAAPRLSAAGLSSTRLPLPQRIGLSSNAYGSYAGESGPLPRMVFYPRNLCKETRFAESIRASTWVRITRRQHPMSNFSRDLGIILQVGPKAQTGHEGQGCL